MFINKATNLIKPDKINRRQEVANLDGEDFVHKVSAIIIQG